MAQIKDILGNSAKTLMIKPGSIFLGPMDGVDHNKFYIIAGVSDNNICICSVLINSTINPFILKRHNLLELQILITSEEYGFLNHNSYINCSNPIMGKAERLKSDSFIYKGSLNETHLKEIVNNIIKSEILTEEQIELYFR